LSNYLIVAPIAIGGRIFPTFHLSIFLPPKRDFG
jgi:hypothetical protein